jgi:hypothetical protein
MDKAGDLKPPDARIYNGSDQMQLFLDRKQTRFILQAVARADIEELYILTLAHLRKPSFYSPHLNDLAAPEDSPSIVYPLCDDSSGERHAMRLRPGGPYPNR